MPVPTIDWIGGVDGHARLIDQTRLPAEFVFLDCRDAQTMWEAIFEMTAPVRKEAIQKSRRAMMMK